jgi:hypothetical protein
LKLEIAILLLIAASQRSAGAEAPAVELPVGTVSPYVTCLAVRELLDDVELRELLLQMSHFWRIVVNDVWIVGMIGGVVLMLSLSRIEGI